MKVKCTNLLLPFPRLVLFLLLLSNQYLFPQVTLTGEQRIWHTTTILFDGPNTSEENAQNPFLNYRLNVTFTAPSGTTLIVPGFYAADGNAGETSATSGNKWAVRFTPNETGNWHYTASFRTGNEVAVNLAVNAGTPTSFDGTSGDFTIVENNKTLPDNRAKGRLNYVGDRYLKFEGINRYFIKAGADSPENLLAHKDFDNAVTNKDWSPHIGDWNTGDPVWKGNKGKGLIGAINYLASKGMNAFSFNMFNLDDPNTNNDGGQKTIWPWSSTSVSLLEGSGAASVNSRTRYDVSKLAQWEILFSHGDRKGMFMHFKTQERGNMKLLDGGGLGVERMLYYREIIARFGHHLALNWNLGEEFHIYDVDIINDLSSYIKAVDPYDHPIVLHSFPGQQENLYRPMLGTTSGLTGVSLQIDITLVHQEVKKWLEESGNSGQQWIVSSDEQGHWRIGVTVDEEFSGSHGSQPDNRDAVRHRVLWGTLMAGGFGAEYYFGTETGETDWASENWRSRETKWEDAKLALDFFNTHLDFWEMDSNDELTTNTEDYCFANINNAYAIYLPNGGTTSLDLNNSSDNYKVQWYDPRNGGDLLDGSLIVISGGAYRNIGLPPTNPELDWVALIQKIQSSHIEVNGISISPNSLSLLEGDNAQLDVELSPSDATNQDVVWSSNNPAVARVSQNGSLTALTEGTATITVRSVDGNFTDTSTVNVERIPTPNSISSFTLVDAGTNLDLFTITNDLAIASNDIEGLQLNVRANTQPVEVGSVALVLSGPVNRGGTENEAPYALFGDSAGNYQGRLLPEGTYILDATPYSGNNNSGLQGTTKTVTFTITRTAAGANEPPMAVATASTMNGTVPLAVNFTANGSFDDTAIVSHSWNFADGNTSAAINPSHTFVSAGNYNVSLTVADAEGLTHTDTVAITVTDPVLPNDYKFTMVSATTNIDLFNMADNMLISSTNVINQPINIRANPEAPNVESVSLKLSGPITRNWTENVAPYALFGDISGNYLGQVLKPGVYELLATAYSGNQLTGTQLETLSIRFTIVDPTADRQDIINIQANNDIFAIANPDLLRSGVILHPNPAIDHVNAEVVDPSAIISQIYIYDMGGSLISGYSRTQDIPVRDGLYKLDTTVLPAGVYLVKVFTDAHYTFHYKLVIKD